MDVKLKIRDDVICVINDYLNKNEFHNRYLLEK